MEKKMINITKEELGNIINTFPIKPRHNYVYVTMNKESDNEEDVILEEQFVQEEQYVIAVGDRVTDIEPGLKVLLDPDKMTKYIQNPNDVTEKIPVVNGLPMEVNDRVFLRITDNVIHSIDYRN